MSAAFTTETPTRSDVESAVVWRLTGIALRLVVQLTTIAILARELEIADFGLAAQAALVTGLATIFSEIGIGAAIVQRESLNQWEWNTACTLSFAIGIAAALLVSSTAGLSMGLVGSTDAAPLLRVSSIAFLFSGISSAQMAYLQRNLDFRSVLFVELGAYVVGYAAVAVSLAIMGAGALSIACAVVGQEIVKATLAYRAVPVKPRPSLRLSSDNAEFFRDGAALGATRILLYGARNVDYLVVSLTMGTGDLGIYSRSYQVMGLPLSRISGLINSIAFPTYSRIGKDRARLEQAFGEAVQLISSVVAPMLVVLSLSSDALVLLLLGPKWGAAAGPLEVLFAAGIPLALLNSSETLCRSRVLAWQRGWRHVVYAAAVTVGVYLSHEGGILVVTLVVASCIACQWLLMTQLALKTALMSPSFYLRRIGPGLLLAGACAATGVIASVGIEATSTASPFARSVVSALAALLIAALAHMTLSHLLLPPQATASVRRLQQRIRR